MTRTEKLNFLANLATTLIQTTTYEKSPVALGTNYMVPDNRTKTLFDEGWRFQWNRGKKRIGCCSYKDKTIELSYIYAENVENPEVLRNTILHEIAHALTPGHHHDNVWKKACVAVGARPDRLCNDPDVISANKTKVPGWKAECSHCSFVHKVFRKPKYINAMGCAATNTCKIIKPKLQWVKE